MTTKETKLKLFRFITECITPSLKNSGRHEVFYSEDKDTFNVFMRFEEELFSIKVNILTKPKLDDETEIF